ncbi:MAG TPA: TIGR00730 family Rossman fold protein [Candidatus Aquabacterium excrementipullorum]|nr:TIGR00730 family Rossman fold protein [Candidatus Aquabacterium excrementipullorum]
MTDASPRADFSVCVYCGSRDGEDARHAQAARDCGSFIGAQGWGLVYGGGSTGLMGTVANAALQAGAPVIGVIPERLIQRELGHGGVTELQVVDSMHQRKQLMAQQSDAFVALPGGIGTMEEIFEIWTWRQLGYHAKPLGLLNVAGYYDDLLRFIERSRESGFLWPDVQELLLVDDQIERLLTRLHEAAVALKAQTPPELQDTAAPGGVARGT